MTAPRQVLPGKTYLVTRRCTRRQFLLKPSATTNGLFLFVLAVAVNRYGMLLHALCVLSNHFHVVLTDPDARLPAFEQYLDSLVARALNASLGHWDSFWDSAGCSAVELLSPADVLDKTAYVLANPVAAGLVAKAREWPGLWSAPERIGCGSIEVPRPEFFFRADGPMPARAKLEFSVPPGFDPEQFRTDLSTALAAREEEAAIAARSKKRGFLGVRRVLAQRPEDSPESFERRRTLKPKVAGKDKWQRIEALARLVEFVRSYRDALNEMRRGVRDVVFPAGTYRLRVSQGVQCAAFT